MVARDAILEAKGRVVCVILSSSRRVRLKGVSIRASPLEFLTYEPGKLASPRS